MNQGRLADLVIVCTGALSAVVQAQESVERGGVVLFFAPLESKSKVPLSFNELFWRNEITLTSSYAGSRQDYAEALRLIADREIAVSDMITHRLGLAEIALGFRLVAEADRSIKVIILMQG
jgi:L-iditol 2-dehydrogenase